jgi:hypothetical protein
MQTNVTILFLHSSLYCQFLKIVTLAPGTSSTAATAAAAHTASTADQEVG